MATEDGCEMRLVGYWSESMSNVEGEWLEIGRSELEVGTEVELMDSEKLWDITSKV